MTSTHNARFSRHRPNTLMLIAAALIAASCADDDDAAESADPATTSASPTVTTSPDTSATSAETTATSAAVTTEGTTEVDSSTSEVTATTTPSPVRPEDAGIVVSSPSCVYRAGELLAEIEDDTDQSTMDAIVGEGAESVPVAAESELTPGLVIVLISDDLDPLDVARQLTAEGVEASPNYLFAFAPGWKYAPFDTPTLYGRQVGGPLSESEVSIAVLDTGFAEVTQEAPPANVADLITPDVPDPHAMTGSPELTHGVAAGHGTFIVNMLGQLLPGATITPAAIGARWDHDDDLALPTPGGQAANVRDDSSVTAALATLAAAGPFAYLNLSFGTYGCTGMIDAPFGDVDAEATAELLQAIPTYLVPLGLRTVLESWGRAGTQVFAASGNDGNRPDHPEVFFPAGWAPLYPWLYSVASDPIVFDNDPTDDDDYSNRGSWVEHQAKGARVVSRLPAIPQWGDAEDWYAWSGTSFATPCALAAHAARTPALESASSDENGAYTDCQINAEAP